MRSSPLTLTIRRGGGKRPPAWIAGALVLLWALPGSFGLAAQAPPPDEDWRAIRTEHFDVVFPAHLESLGRSAAGYAEGAHSALSRLFAEPPDARIHLLITDHSDISNGFTTWRPYNRIVVHAAPPVEGRSTAYNDDWLELVITHELAHTFHLDRRGWVGDVVSTVFGRVGSDWPVFPNWGSPKWVIEGLATYYESLVTGTGRVEGTFFDMVLRTAALEGRLEGLDQISGESPVWPAGNTRYVYGAMFLDHLVARSEATRLGDFADRTSGALVPFLIDRAGDQSLGASFSRAYGRWVDSVTARAVLVRDSLAALAPPTEIQRLTDHGRIASYPQATPDGETILYVRSDGRSDVQLRRLTPDGSGGGSLGRLNSEANFDVAPDGSVVASEMEFEGPYRLRAGLVRIATDGGRRWIARGARLDQPSLSPDGTQAVAVQEGEGTTRLVRVDLGTGAVAPFAPFDPDVRWAYPAWSPDGRWIVASRGEPGAYYDLWLLTAEGTAVGRLTRDRAMDQGATWSPDGGWLVWSSDRTGIANLYGLRLGADGTPGPVRQVTNVITGVEDPRITPDGEHILVSVYGAEGWDVGRIRFDPERWFAPFDPAPRLVGDYDGGLDSTPVSEPVRGYSPLPTLLPSFWELNVEDRVTRRGREVLGYGLGFSLGQSDLVRRHSYSAAAIFRTSGRTDASVAYTNRSLGNPTVSLSFNQFHSTDGPFTVAGASGDTVYRAERERALRLTVGGVRQRVRSRWGLSLFAAHVWEDRWLLDTALNETTLTLQRPDLRSGELGATASVTTARGQAFSTSVAEGLTLVATVRRRDELNLPDSLSGVRGADRSFKDVIARLTAYESFDGPGFSSHTLAVRGAFGHAWGPGADAFHFFVGGAAGSPESVTGFELFGGRGLLLPVRGYLEGQQAGRTAWSASAEYRFPLLNIHRGIGLVPVHADRLSGALFFDAGNAWGPEVPGQGALGLFNPRPELLTSVGAELQTDILVLFNSTLTLRLGYAHPLSDAPDQRFYLRVGASF